MKKDLPHCSTVGALLFLFAAGMPSVIFCQSYDLVHQFDSDTTLNIQTQLQYAGSVIVDSAGNEENQRALPLDVNAKLKFDQRISSSSTKQPQAIRFFESAAADIKAGKGATETKLTDANRLVIARLAQEQNENHVFEVASLEDRLSQKEYELLKTPGDCLAYPDLFNKQGVKVGDRWQPSKDLIADLVSINRVITCDVSMMLKSVEDGLAKIYLFGDIKGESDDVITNMGIKGIAMLDMQEKMVKSLRMTIDEDRRAGQFAPGFEGKIKLDSRISRTGSNPKLSKQQLAKIYKGKKVKFDFMLAPNDSPFQLVHTKNWRVIASQSEAAVLRYISDGQLIAQCNVVELPRRPADNPLTLQDFKTEISKIAANAQGAEIAGSSEIVTASGLQALRVAVDGFEQEIPFSWLYYHISANDGRRVTFVFTLEKDAEDYFNSADRLLVDNFSFKPDRSARNKTLPKKTQSVR